MGQQFLLRNMSSNWEQLAADKQTRINDSMPEEWRIQELPTEDSVFDFPAKSGLLTDQELSITESSATDLVQQLAQGKLKAVDVTIAFCKRAALAHQLVSKSYRSILVSSLYLTIR